MSRAKDSEHAETEARLQQAIAEYKNDKKRTRKTLNPRFAASLKTSTFLIKLSAVASTDMLHAIKLMNR